MINFDDFQAECDRGPRINQMTAFFAATAAGESGMPSSEPKVNGRLLPRDRLMQRLIDLHEARHGFFDLHYHASIPYRLEEEMRMAYAIFKYAYHRATPLILYTMGTAEGTLARILAEIADGHVKTLSCSPNVENLACFMAHGQPLHAKFFLGPFHHLTKERLTADSDFTQFRTGFDIILEDTTFQMYSRNRRGQIEFLLQNLARDGILLLLEKFKNDDEAEYIRRESQKDFGFKARYFSATQLAAKSEIVLGPMYHNEVSLREIAEVLYAHFAHSLVLWNSGNFYGLAASNSWNNLSQYLSGMPDPAIPGEYVYSETLYQSGFAHLNTLLAAPDRR